MGQGCASCRANAAAAMGLWPRHADVRRPPALGILWHRFLLTRRRRYTGRSGGSGGYGC
jgi:hypothetical protein